jgi:hypothetical protein
VDAVVLVIDLLRRALYPELSTLDAGLPGEPAIHPRAGAILTPARHRNHFDETPVLPDNTGTCSTFPASKRIDISLTEDETVTLAGAQRELRPGTIDPDGTPLAGA